MQVRWSASGKVVWQWDNQDPFGNNVPNENPSSQGTFHFNLRFPGQYYDAETNLAYNVNRDYDASIGRYVESDPIGLGGGINTYAYVDGNPVAKSDPSGLEPKKDIPAQRLRNCNEEEYGSCMQQCSPRPVDSCKVPQTFKITRMKGGLTGRGWVDGPMSCSCQEPENDGVIESICNAVHNLLFSPIPDRDRHGGSNPSGPLPSGGYFGVPPVPGYAW